MKGKQNMELMGGTDIEFKELDSVPNSVPDSLIKSVCAFANMECGEIYIGIRDNGMVVDVDDFDDVMTELPKLIDNPTIICYTCIIAMKR